MPPVTAEDRLALLREGIVVVDTEVGRGRHWIGVAGAGPGRVHDVARSRFGDGADIEILGLTPRWITPWPCVAHREREPGRLQLRLLLSGDDHLEELLVEEDDRAVVVYATVCTSVAGRPSEPVDVPAHVYLRRPLDGREVIDGSTGQPVPYRRPLGAAG